MSVQRKLALIDVTDKTHSVFHQIVIIIYIIASRIKVLFLQSMNYTPVKSLELKVLQILAKYQYEV